MGPMEFPIFVSIVPYTILPPAHGEGTIVSGDAYPKNPPEFIADYRRARREGSLGRDRSGAPPPPLPPPLPPPPPGPPAAYGGGDLTRDLSEQIDSGLRQIESGRRQIDDALRQIGSGLPAGSYAGDAYERGAPPGPPAASVGPSAGYGGGAYDRGAPAVPHGAPAGPPGVGGGDGFNQ